MPALNVSKSIEVNAPASKVLQILTDFRQWPMWSPWLVHEPDAILEYASDGQSYSWKGKRIGSGEMSISYNTEKIIKLDLAFLKPWKSKGKAEFHLSENQGVTHVTWKMFGALPFFMFFLKKMMESLIGMDYERGLSMLKQYVEEGKVDSALTFKGIESYPGCEYVGITRTLPMDRMEEMENDFKKLDELFGDQGIWSDMDTFCIYHKFDMTKRKVEYTVGVPVTEVPSELPQGIVSGSIPACQVHTVSHKGPYRYLGNVWSTQQSMMRAKEFKAKKGAHPFETYANNPLETPDSELITNVHFVVK